MLNPALIVFLQPELRSERGGHFFQYISGIIESLKVKGFKSLLIANEDFNYGIHHRPTNCFKKINIPAHNRYLMLGNIISENIRCIGEFKKIIEGISKNQPDTLFFVDTILNNKVLGFAFACRQSAKIFPNIRFAVVFRFTYKSNSIIYTWLQKKLHLWFYKFVKKLVVGNRMIMITDSTLLKESYDNNIPPVTKLFPLPIRQALYSDILLKRTEKKNQCIGFIGGKGGYKGLDVFLKIIIQLQHTSCTFLVHGVENTEDLFQYANSKLNPEELSSFYKISERIFTLSFLDEADYLLMFAKIDIILIPYSSLQFVEGTSTIFTESVSAGILTLVPENSWMSHELLSAEMNELVVDFNNTNAAAYQLDDILINKTAIQSKMNTFLNNWQSYHSADTFTDILMSSL